MRPGGLFAPCTTRQKSFLQAQGSLNNRSRKEAETWSTCNSTGSKTALIQAVMQFWYEAFIC